ncbi:diguanylate cyclase domain-containing protein [Paenibacillus koleovorans]|uniref:diguanylate cyclase domain-containing protein n=1 Tax=Paenibacillus koleovorans TaxID=121608 RepID=UPI0013E326CD|nr:diguanylate cyclase [Paenibacillus koleovorans]
MKPILNLKWRAGIPYERLDSMILPLVIFTSSCAIATVYSNWRELLVAALFSLALILLMLLRKSQTAVYGLAFAALTLLLVVFPAEKLYCFLLILYPLLLLFALLVTNPQVPFAAGLISALFLFRFQTQIEEAELWANIFAVALNAFVFSVLAHMMRRLYVERNEYFKLSMIDSLTGLPSLQQTLLFGEKLLERGVRLKVLLIDMDYFKQINDTYGHMVGNKVIVHVAEALRNLVEGMNATVGRLGGDEFVIVTEDNRCAEDLLQRIKEKLNNSEFVPASGMKPILISFSIGEATSNPSSTSHIEQLMHEADLNMYEYKLSNRVPLLHNQSEQLFELNPDPICTFDTRGRLLDMNPAAERLTGYMFEELKDRPFAELVAEENREEAVSTFRTATAIGSANNLELMLIQRGGTLIPLNVTYIPIIVNHKVAGFHILSRSLEHRRKAEEQLRQSERQSAMGKLADRAVAELRTPLTLLGGFTRLLQEQQPQERPYYAVMLTEVQRIEQFVEDLQFVAQPLEKPQERRSPIELVQDAIVSIETRAARSQVEIRLSTSNAIPPVRCDSQQLKRVFVQVMLNAIESMPNGGQLSINLEFKPPQVSIRFTDTGQGLQMSQVRHSGETFYSSKSEASGLGLMAATRVLENHGGSYHQTGGKGEESTVELRLPK